MAEANLSDFLKTRWCIEWRTELPTASAQRRSPVFLFHNTECYFFFVREYTTVREGLDFIGNRQPEHFHSVYLKQVKTPPINIPGFSGEVLAGMTKLDAAAAADAFSTRVRCDTDTKPVWRMSEKDLKAKIQFDFAYGNTFRFFCIFDGLSAPTVQSETGNQSVQTSNVSGISCLECLSEDFYKLLGGDKDHDVVLKCGDCTLPAHKNVLRARSSVFAAMLSCDMLENRTNCVTLQDMDEVQFREFVRYLYSGTLSELSWDSATKLFAVGDKYAVESLKNRCAAYLADNLTPENACECLALADAHSDSDLKETVIPYILDNGVPLLLNLWQPFAREHPDLATEVLYRFYQLQKQD